MEENPGPARCDVCERTFAANNTPLSCAACGALAYGSCSGMTRAQKSREEPYTCGKCGGERRREECLRCGAAFRVGSRRIECGGCRRTAHAACTGLTRDQIRRTERYTCERCCGDRPVEQAPEDHIQPPVPPEERVCCGICHITLRRGANCAQCGTCAMKAHKKCAGLARGQQEWRCAGCRRVEPRRDLPEAEGEREQPGAALDVPQTQPRNEKCPKCQKKMRRTDCPLTCRTCGNRFHIKCAKETRDTLSTQRRAGTWECGFCGGQPEREPASTGGGGGEAMTVKTGQRLSELKIMQWNCDGLSTKRDELEELLRREGIQVVLLQETKLGQKDETPRIRGYTATRKDRPGSGTIGPRAGGLCTYVQEGLAHWEEELTVGGVLEGQCTTIPLSGGRKVRLLNLYIPPVRGEEAGREWECALRHLEGLPTGEATLWCGDLNAHHELWDPFLPADRRGNDLAELMEQRSLITLNDGSPTRYQRFEREDRPGGPGRSAPDVTVIAMEGNGEVGWAALEDLSSDHVPVLIAWKKEGRINKQVRRIELNMKKGDWRRYGELMEEGMAEIEEEEIMKKKLAKLTTLMIESGKKVCPVKTIREENIPWMTAEIKRLRRMRNRARRDMRRRRSEWVNICRELKEKTREAKRETWRKHLEKISAERDTNMAWSVVKKLAGGKVADSGGGAMFYEGRWRHNPKGQSRCFRQRIREDQRKKYEQRDKEGESGGGARP